MTVPEFIYRFRWLTLLLVSGIGIVSILLLPRLKVQVDFSDFFPEGDAELEFYEYYKTQLGSEDNFLSVVIVPDRGVFNKPFLDKLEQFTLELAGLRQVRAANSIATIQRTVATPFGFYQSPYVDLADPDRFPSDSLRILHEVEFTDSYYFPDAGAVAVLIEMDDNLTLIEADTLISSIIDTMGPYEFPESHLGGKSFLEVSYSRMVQSEISSSIAATLLVIVVMLGLMFRSISGVLIPVFSMILALIIQYGYMAVFNRPLGILANLFPTVVLIVGISDVVHIGIRFDEEIRKGLNRQSAILETIRVIGWAIFLTSLTTAVGFLTFRTSIMRGLQDFGLDAAVAVMIAFGVTILVVPAVLSSFESERVFSNRPLVDRWNRAASGIHRVVSTHPGRIYTVTGVAFLLALVGAGQIDTNNKLMTSIPEHDRAHDDTRYFDNRLGGIRTLELAVETRGTARINSVHVLSELNKLHNYLDGSPQFNYVRSPISHYRGMNRVFNPTDGGQGTFAENDELLHQQEARARPVTALMRYRMVDSTATLGRVSFRIKDPGRKVVASIYQDLADWIATNIDGTIVTFRPTGIHQMIDRGHEHRISNMYRGLGIALAVVAFLIGLLLKRGRLIVLTLVVNIVPLVLVAGAMGFLGIELRGTTTIIFTIGFVIAIDNTIHFLSQYSMRRQMGMTLSRALETTIKQTGRAILTTSIVLMGGFLILLHSASWEVYMHGLLVSMILVFALLANLFLLPALLRFDRVRPDSATGPGDH